jgi:hypothetical protein
VDPDKKEKENVNGYERHEFYPGQKIYFIENQYQQYQQKDHQHDIDQAVGREYRVIVIQLFIRHRLLATDRWN